MYLLYTKIAAAAAGLVWAAAAGAATDSGAAYRGLAGEIAGYAAANGIGKVVVADFSAKGETQRPEADYVSEKIAGYLGAGAAPELVDSGFLKKMFQAGGGPRQQELLRGELLSIDAVVSGTVFAQGDTIRVLVRLVDARKGRVLFSGEAEGRRDRQEAGASALYARRPAGGVYQLGPELPGILVPVGDEGQAEAWPRLPSDLRDALAERRADPCAAREELLAGRNEDLVEAKAAYWAKKMRGAGYSSLGLRKNPGSEIADPAVRARFYKLLAGYYNGGAPGPAAEERYEEVARLMEDEARFAAECGGP